MSDTNEKKFTAEELKSKAEAAVMAMRAMGMTAKESLVVFCSSIAYLCGITDKPRAMMEWAVAMLLRHDSLVDIPLDDIMKEVITHLDILKGKSEAKMVNPPIKVGETSDEPDPDKRAGR
jgi:hypothetical protein